MEFVGALYKTMDKKQEVKSANFGKIKVTFDWYCTWS